uniref:BSD domain-containing protein n=1 Tax=Mesocestoides corti TaxID=53468 RepID=A0A5K3EPB0_MESCO
MSTSSPPDTSLEDQVQASECGPPQQNYFGWLKSTFSQPTEVWDQIKQDITEVAQAVASSDPIAAAKGTASSVYRQFSDAVHSLQQGAKSDPPPPENETARDTTGAGDVNLESPMSSVKSSFYEIVDALEKGLTELTGASFSFGLKANNAASGGGGSGGNRDARIDVIRADPATFESSPSPQKDILPYEEWRKAYFNDQTCSPHPDTPIFEGSTLPTGDAPSATYPPPSRVLEESPVVRRHLLRLVDPDGGSGSLSETDFWSRYYYRVWCLDVLQLRSTRLVNKLEKDHVDNAADDASMGTWPELVDDNDENDDDEIKSDRNEDVLKASTVSISSETSPCDTQPAEGSNAGYFSPASSIIIVNREEVTGDEAEAGQPQSEAAAGDEWREDVVDPDDDEVGEDDERVQVTLEGLKETKLKTTSDNSDSGSEWEKWA